ncbi:MAG: hypothetical protein DRR19_14500 [Candidatus Parabeggiatoa sp. nov. 1]|nr:MAG: hypothetical protein DRR19_14500 [Gammaproteobacteria bacterium]
MKHHHDLYGSELTKGAFPKKGSLSILGSTLEYNGYAKKTDKKKIHLNEFLKIHRLGHFELTKVTAVELKVHLLRLG